MDLALHSVTCKRPASAVTRHGARYLRNTLGVTAMAWASGHCRSAPINIGSARMTSLALDCGAPMDRSRLELLVATYLLASCVPLDPDRVSDGGLAQQGTPAIADAAAHARRWADD